MPKLKIKFHNNDLKVRTIQIKDRTKNKYGLPTSLAMERMLNK
jgi:hypothetical protein